MTLPLYDFECTACGQKQEQFFKMDDCPAEVSCECGATARKTFAIGHGGIFSDRPKWLDDGVRGALQDDELLRKGKVEPIETREQLNRHLKEHNLAPVSAFREI